MTHTAQNQDEYTMLDQITAITNVSAKNWQPFDLLTPGGIPFAGYVCRHESDKLGAAGIHLRHA